MTAAPPLTDAYIALVKQAILDMVYPTEFRPVTKGGPLRQWILRALRARGFVIAKVVPITAQRVEGTEWPGRAMSMMGIPRMDNLQKCVETVLKDRVPGDLIETGVWRGGGTVMMRAILKAYGDTERRVWVADSFQGLPRPNADLYPTDRGDDLYSFEALAVSQAQVEEHFRRFGLLDDQVRFLKGWFKDTLPTAPISRLAVMRLDGDMYESTMDALKALYPKLSSGGFCIIDDYGGIQACKQAVTDYRASHSIAEPIQQIDWTGVYWRKA